MRELWLDTETYSETDLKKHGTHRSMEDKNFEIMLFPYAIDDGDVKLWDVTDGSLMPSDLHDALYDDRVVKTAWNAQYDRLALRYSTTFAEVLIGEWRCLMVKALCHGMPGSLEEAGRVVGLSEDQAKIKDGKKLIQRFCKPAPSNHKAHRYTSVTHPEEWQRFREYAINDVVAMREIDKRLPNWNFPGYYGKTGDTAHDELKLWHLDQHINDYGFCVDRKLVNAGVEAAIRDKQIMANRFVQLTGGHPDKPTKRAAFLELLNTEYGMGLGDTRAETFKGLLESDKEIHPVARELMTISVNANKSSTAKFASMQNLVSSDGRFRGGLQFAGAARTRRHAGRGFQPQNLPSRFAKHIGEAVPDFIDALKDGLDDVFFDDKERMQLGSAALRGVIVAPKGRIIHVADLSNIEGRDTAWLAGAEDKLDAFRANDAGTGPDLYCVAVGQVTGMDPHHVPKALRNGLGKPMELGLGYQGGVNALGKMLGNNRMHDHWGVIQTSVDRMFVEKAQQNFAEWGIKKTDLDSDEWIARETVKLAWRAKNPKISRLWYKINDAAKGAIRQPGRIFEAGPHLKYRVLEHAGHKYLLCKMPSGRVLCYFDPRISERDGKISYMGQDSTNGRRIWARRYFYGGLALENAAQSFAGDILKHSMPLIHNDGFGITLSVHDELLCEDDDLGTAGNAERLYLVCKHMATAPVWAPGLPLNAEGFSDYRYRKD